MNLHDVEPSLCAAEPLLESLHDGFSPPAIALHTPTPSHPVEPDPFPPETDSPASNPTQLPIEPEFGQALPPAEPEDPGVNKPKI